MPTSDDDRIARDWTDAFTGEVLAYARLDDVSNEEVFADVYHALVHHTAGSGSACQALIRLEHTNAQAIDELCKKRDEELAALDARHAEEIADAVQRDDEATEKAVNRLAARHMEERQMALLKWESELGHARDTQAREFRQWVMCVHEELETSAAAAGKPVPLAADIRRSVSGGFLMESALPSTAPVLQESFTITLGAQMKQMHNLRLVASDPLDLCRYSASEDDALPQRLQTAMSLYSSNLSGLVLLTDDRLSAYSGIEKDFSDLCQRATELHFPTFEQQLQTVKEDHLSKALKWREEHRRRKLLEEEAEVDQKTTASDSKVNSLRSGDFFITRHSNLCEMHVVFHMMCDDSVMSGNINSRCPVIMGLRNVLKTASLSDVTTLTLPLLLTHTMSEEMTVTWCMKRAELVFKCVKGFMMEVTSWGGSEIKTLQFLVPRDINHDVFNRLTSMLSGIFRTSNPIRGH